MTAYYRPILNWSADRPDGALALAGGWCWFDCVAVHRRDAQPSLIAATDLPAAAHAMLTSPRERIAGLSMAEPHIMGILNATPDSFSDGGQFMRLEAARAHVGKMLEDGVSIVDIGGESTRPGAALVPEEEEISRTIPVLEALAQSGAVFSIDTRKAEVASAAIAAGARIINDVAAFTYDPALLKVTAASDLPVCLMHAQGDPATMQDNPRYDDVLLDVYDFLAERIAFAEAGGIKRSRIIVDPGIGFGKTLAHNLTLLRGLSLFHSLGCPVLLGASRKRFIGTIGAAPEAADRMAGSVAVALEGVRQGVQILRVHDTFETKQALDLAMAIHGAGQI